jgi:hypothetical protein
MSGYCSGDQACSILWVPKTHPSCSRNESVLVDETAQDVRSLEVRAVGLTGRRRSHVGVARCLVAERPVRPVSVVVLDVLGEDGFEVAPFENEHPVQALARGGADEYPLRCRTPRVRE